MLFLQHVLQSLVKAIQGPILSALGGAVASWLVRSTSDRVVRVRVLGPFSRKARKLFGLVKPQRNLELYDYRAVLFTYS